MQQIKILFYLPVEEAAQCRYKFRQQNAHPRCSGFCLRRISSPPDSTTSHNELGPVPKEIPQECQISILLSLDLSPSTGVDVLYLFEM